MEGLGTLSFWFSRHLYVSVLTLVWTVSANKLLFLSKWAKAVFLSFAVTHDKALHSVVPTNQLVPKQQFRCCCLVAQSCLFWDPTDCSPPGSSVHGILQARILEWVAIPFLTQASNPKRLNYSTNSTCWVRALPLHTQVSASSAPTLRSPFQWNLSWFPCWVRHPCLAFQ